MPKKKLKTKIVRVSPKFKKALEQAVVDHVHFDEGIESIFLMPDPNEQELKLLEVTRSAVTTGTVWPVKFAPQPQNKYPLPLNLIVVSPDEWEMIEEDNLGIPEKWGRRDGLVQVYPAQ